MARLRDSLPHVHAGGGGTMASKTVEAGETDEDTQKQCAVPAIARDWRDSEVYPLLQSRRKLGCASPFRVCRS